jgi:hypothetical protein
MIKTLRITTVLAAFLAAGFFAFPVFFGSHGDEKIEEYLKLPGAIEKFNQAKGAKVPRAKNQVPPLVTQAMAFGLYRNPPRKPAPIRKPTTPVRTAAVPTLPDLPIKVTSTKFKLVGTSFHSARPERSWAYIDAPGTGKYWLKQGSKVAHLLIEKVNHGSVVVKDRDKSIILIPERKPKKSLIKGENDTKATAALSAATSITSTSTSTSAVTAQIGDGKSPALVTSKATNVVNKSNRRPVNTRRRPASVVPKPPTIARSARRPEVEKREAEMLEKLAAQLSAVDVEGGPGKVESHRSAKEGQALLDKFMADIEAMRVSPKEAKRLDRLGKELKKNDQLDPNRARNSKIGRSRSIPRPPKRPPR